MAIYRRLYEVRILRAQMQGFQGSSLFLSRIPAWENEITANRSLMHARSSEIKALTTAMVQTDAELARSTQEEDMSTPSSSRTSTESGDGALGDNFTVAWESLVTTMDPPTPRGRGSQIRGRLAAVYQHRQATAAAPPRQPASLSCASSWATPADDDNHYSTTGGQGEGRPCQNSSSTVERAVQWKEDAQSDQDFATLADRDVPYLRRRVHLTTQSQLQSHRGRATRRIRRRGGRTVATGGPRPTSGREVPLPRHRPACLHYAHRKSPTDHGRTSTTEPYVRQLWTAEKQIHSTQQGRDVLVQAATVTVPCHELEHRQLQRARRDLQVLRWRHTRLRQDHARLAHGVEQLTVAVDVHGEGGDDDDATVAASNLSGVDCCEDVLTQLKDGADEGDINAAAPDGEALLPTGEVEVAPITTWGNIYTLQSVLATPLKAFAPAHTSSDDIRQIETTNQHKSQDLEGLPPVPRRKRRRVRKRKRTRRCPGQAKKSRPRHSPVTPPHLRQGATSSCEGVSSSIHSIPLPNPTFDVLRCKRRNSP
ncbi:hypothetical protein THAOC_01209 [Thalassiosira oceanica]|uniref:Uncharacterized protein n=1 Tax=Thalassiosira oceanica TaxID=159749 RepID=K0TIS9_THAOC|nr:hypothetical protein THAOC_01209 [Thalassiosira oceanica]|eukprot:EJK76989.1 hypothetical protein THAOC_01209 [Thalassiosira oceanica]